MHSCTQRLITVRHAVTLPIVSHSALPGPGVDLELSPVPHFVSMFNV